MRTTLLSEWNKLLLLLSGCCALSDQQRQWPQSCEHSDPLVSPLQMNASTSAPSIFSPCLTVWHLPTPLRPKGPFGPMGMGKHHTIRQKLKTAGAELFIMDCADERIQEGNDAVIVQPNFAGFPVTARYLEKLLQGLRGPAGCSLEGWPLCGGSL